MMALGAISETVETTPVARMELRAKGEIRKRDPGIFGDYWWANRFLNHREQVARLNGRPVDVVLVGDSIMHYWEWRHLAKWSALTNGRTVLNLGYAGDRTQHVLWRIAHGEKWTSGRSHCPSCGHELGVRDLFPILSWVLLKGKCRYCGAKV